MKTVILAGGQGTRLRPVIGELPKPLASVAGKPFLEYLILQLRGWGFRDIILSIGYKGALIKSYFKDGGWWGVNIGYAEEQEPLGTGGGVKAAMQMAGEDDVLILNGDSFFAADLNAIEGLHKHVGATATLALAVMTDTERYGRVVIDHRTGAVTDFLEKGRTGEGLINGGIYVLNRRILNHIPDGTVSLERNVFPRMIGLGMYGMPCVGDFIDIGVPEAYESLCRNPAPLLKGAKRVGP